MSEGYVASQGRDRRHVAAGGAAYQTSRHRSPPVPMGSGDMNNLRNACQRPSPSIGLGFQLPHLTLGTGFVKLKRGVEKPKGTEQLKITARGRNIRGEDTAMSDRVDLRRRGTQRRVRSVERGFFLRFPPSRRELRSFIPLYNHAHRMWGNIGSRGTAADSASGRGGGRTGFYDSNRGSASTSTK